MISGTHGFPDRAGITVSFLILRPHLGAPALTHRIGNKTWAAAIKRPGSSVKFVGELWLGKLAKRMI